MELKKSFSTVNSEKYEIFINKWEGYLKGLNGKRDFKDIVKKWNGLVSELEGPNASKSVVRWSDNLV